MFSLLLQPRGGHMRRGWSGPGTGEELANKVRPFRCIGTREIHVDLGLSQGRYRNDVSLGQRMPSWQQQAEWLETQELALHPRRLCLSAPISATEGNVELAYPQLHDGRSDSASVPSSEFELPCAIAKSIDDPGSRPTPATDQVDQDRARGRPELGHDAIVESDQFACPGEEAPPLGRECDLSGRADEQRRSELALEAGDVAR